MEHSSQRPQTLRGLQWAGHVEVKPTSGASLSLRTAHPPFEAIASLLSARPLRRAERTSLSMPESTQVEGGGEGEAQVEVVQRQRAAPPRAPRRT